VLGTRAGLEAEDSAILLLQSRRRKRVSGAFHGLHGEAFAQLGQRWRPVYLKTLWIAVLCLAEHQIP